ncbi:DNA-processing protein DprA [Pseudoroseicyclus tamaricis]|uniref:DNA-protecting protein DprA n=1 Tax=Pseudoroseicyclus tamaricis TaxID=2705421 RepID=A0A6B2JU14_9RHOB|nr:DNA-processing protein DprA [Pseudoroseicyclus tamaricis]NDV01778.1 DNA-protecting protein DprA [Pseudoroseicyclus tamaricis]
MAGATPSSTHPPLPPTTEDERLSWLRLLRSRRVGPQTFHRLLRQHGSAGAALTDLPGLARNAGETEYQVCPEGIARAELKAARRAGAHFLAFGAPDYPAALSDLPDAPPILWGIGDLSLLKRPIIAMVGARNASSLGLRMARRLAQELGEEGFVIASGLARGIDAAAHAAALPTGTIAVFAGGLDITYPPQNVDLAKEVAARGLLLSEQPFGRQPQARHFPLRNRIVSGLARAVVVVEAAAKSGSLITARAALDQGREVLAVPGHPLDSRASGCNMLLRDGATLVRRAEDVISALGPAPQPCLPLEEPAAPAPLAETVAALPSAPTRPTGETRDLHAAILDRLGHAPLAEDQLLRDLGARADEAAPALTELELGGRIRRETGGLLTRDG